MAVIKIDQRLTESARTTETRADIRRMRDEKRRRLRRKRLLIVCSLLAAGIALVVVLIVASPGKRLPKVPDVIGLTYKQAKNKVEAVGLVIDIHPLQNTSKIKDIERLKVQTQSPDRKSVV